MRFHKYKGKPIIILMISVMGCFGSNAVSSEYCEDFPLVIESKDKNITGAKLDENHMKILGLSLEKDSFKDAEKLFGAINEFRRKPGCASCGEEACYSSLDGRSSLIFYRYAGWDFTAFSVKHNQEGVAESHCIKSMLVTNNLSTDSGIKLGLEKKEIIRMFGKPVHKDKYDYEYSQKVKQDRETIIRIKAEPFVYGSDGMVCEDFYNREGAHANFTFFNKNLTEFTIGHFESAL